MANGSRRVGGRSSVRRLRDYEARLRELTAAFNLPPDMRTWVTVRLDTDPDTEDVISVAGQAGMTTVVTPYPLPAKLKSALQDFLNDHREDMEHQLKLDLAKNLLAQMSGAPALDEEDGE